MSISALSSANSVGTVWFIGNEQILFLLRNSRVSAAEAPMGIALTVLFAEDETPIRDSVSQLLSMSGFRVLKAEDGYEALRLLTQEEVDLLFTDIVMPGLDGIELARRARRIRPNLKIMFITGYSAKSSEALHLGSVLYKPMRGNQIEAELRSFLLAS